MHDQAAPVAGCALVYHESGWNPLELPQHAKGPPPEGRTGHAGIDMTAAEIRAAAWTGNIGLRMSWDVIGLDIDAYRGGLQTLADLVAMLGPLPATWISHNGRNDQSGIRFYRVPRREGWVTGLVGIDIIQQGHRYAAVWPSVHPDGRVYDWWDQTIGAPAEQIPYVDDLPDLPWPWIAHLERNADGTHTAAANTEQLGDFIDRHTQADQPSYLTVICAHYTAQTEAGRSRHDEMQHCLTWAMEHAAAGVVSAHTAVKRLSGLWVATVAPDSRRAELFSPRRTTEFDAMLRHAVGKALGKTADELARLHLNTAGVGIAVYQPEATAPGLNGAGRRITLHSVENTQPRRARWLWDGRIPLGSLSLLGGREGIGKSILGYTLAARVTTGQLEGELYEKPRPVAIVATEDSWEHTIIPRLIVAGADRKLIHRVEVTVDAKAATIVLPHDIEALHQATVDVGAALVLLDPIISRLDASLDTHKDAEVRQGLEPLAENADKGHYSILGLIHVSKSMTNDPLTMLMASRAFAAVARSVLFTTLDTEQPGMRLLGEPKNNLGRTDLPTLMFDIVERIAGNDPDDGLPIKTGALRWAGVSQRTILEALHDAGRSPDAKDKQQEAEGWLTDYLTVNPVAASKDIKKAGAKEGHSERTLKRAQQAIGAGVMDVGFPRHTVWSAPGLTPDEVEKALSGQTLGPTGKSGKVGDLQSGQTKGASTDPSDKHAGQRQ